MPVWLGPTAVPLLAAALCCSGGGGQKRSFRMRSLLKLASHPQSQHRQNNYMSCFSQVKAFVHSVLPPIYYTSKYYLPFLFLLCFFCLSKFVFIAKIYAVQATYLMFSRASKRSRNLRRALKVNALESFFIIHI